MDRLWFPLVVALVLCALPLSRTLAQCNASWQNEPDPPFARAFFAAAYDAGRDQLVLFGGQGGSGPGGNSAETWVLSGSTWTLINTPGPSARNSAAMVYDAVRGRCVLFGGASQSVLNNETWEWDGSTWTLVSTSGPLARSQHSMAYDGSRHRTVLFGGVQQNGAMPADTWEWDGSQWTQVAAVGPSGRFLASMTYDLVRGEVVLFGGRRFDAGSESDETWTWNGLAWTLKVVLHKPPARSASSMWWDPVSHDIGLYGGNHTLLGYDASVWRWDGAEWAAEPASGGTARIGHFACFNWSNGRTTVVGGTGPGVGVGTNMRSLIRSAPSIDTDPQPASTCRKGLVALSVEATGGVGYTWRHGVVPLVDGGAILGSNTPNLLLNGQIEPLTADLSGSYDCIVTNGCGQTITAPALVTISACPADLDNGEGLGTCDGAVTIDDLLYFLAAFEAGSADADLDDGSGNGTMDGAVTIDDLLYFLVHFEAGC